MVSIPVLSNIIEGLKVFFKTRRYVAYLIIFFITSFISFFVSYILSIPGVVGSPTETVLVNVFAYVGATGTIYFMLGTILLLVGLDKVWITRRGRGRITELKGIAWIAVSFFIAVWLSVFFKSTPLYLFAAVGWVGWIGFQAYLSSRTSLRIATIAEPKKGGIAKGFLAFIILIIGIGIIAAEAILALVVIPQDLFGISTMLGPVFPNFQQNISLHFTYIIVAFALLGIFALIALVAYFRYALKGAALNIALLTVFIAIYSGYFLVNVMRRTSVPSMEPVDIAMTLFFLVYAMSGIGRTVTESVEESRFRVRDLGPLITFMLASGFFFVDSLITASTYSPQLAAWFDWSSTTNYVNFIFRDVAKLLAFPLVAIFSMLYYLKVERVERVVERIKEEGEEVTPEEVDKEVYEEVTAPETPEQIEEGRPGADLQGPPDTARLRVDPSRRFKPGKRLGQEDDNEE